MRFYLRTDNSLPSFLKFYIRWLDMESSEVHFFNSFLLLLLLSSGGNARNHCHFCMWTTEETFPDMEPNLDPVNVCLPKDFDVSKVPQAICPFGCITVAIYDYVQYANLPRGLLEDGNQSPVVVAADAERTAVLTLFFRGCAPFPIDEDTCKRSTSNFDDEVQTFHHVCFCSHHLCNGKNYLSEAPSDFISSGSNIPYGMWTLLLTLVYCVFGAGNMFLLVF